MYDLGELGLRWRRREEAIFGFPFKQREGKEKEKKSRFGTLIFVSMELLYGLLVWNLYVWICWLGNPPNSLFAYVWVRRTLSLYKSDFCWC